MSDQSELGDGAVAASPEIQLRYVGKRFEGARLPLDVLGDLPAFRDLLTAFAKASFLVQYPQKKRVPKGFDKSLSFDLTGVNDGSAVPQLRWNRENAQSLLPEFGHQLDALVEGSLQDIASLIDDSSRGVFPKVLSPEHVRALNRFGSGLKEGERIEFLGRAGADGNVVYLDSDRRRQLITKVGENYQTRYEGTGTLVGAHAANDPYVEIQTALYGQILIPIDKKRVLEEFDGNLGGAVQFAVEIQLDSRDSYRKTVDVHTIGLVDEGFAEARAKCDAKLIELGSLTTGWDDGPAEAITPRALDNVRKFLGLLPQLCSGIKIFPTQQGGVLSEFEWGRWDLSVEFLKSGEIEFFGIEISGPGEIQPKSFVEIDGGLIGEISRMGVNADD